MIKRAKNYSNKHVTESLGVLLKNTRITLGYSLGDLSEMTQFPKSTIINLENGLSTNIHYYVAYAQAVEFPILPIDLVFKPIFELSPERKERLFLTHKINELVKDQLYFQSKRSVGEIIIELRKIYKIETSRILSTNVSRVLLNLVEDGILELAEKKGRNNLYVKK
ncbi:helix-turn-helix domain-containing protein [Mucilaginibacter polytrichastri]|uniref:helix-turn-helix domain-containing protein n=1 Tax=Mucilaginibacter polytrichastri TaxID=1302689 RepID=UPI0008EA71B6|nr:hypothetical protein [Mucilaginibacter polytrichastri]SFT05157.1 hypothetical protein SAMN04487890_10978 [Mucilaginibacter polytrichastri]